MIRKASFSQGVPIRHSRSSYLPYSAMYSMFLRTLSGSYFARIVQYYTEHSSFPKTLTDITGEEKRFYGKILILRIRFYKAVDNIFFRHCCGSLLSYRTDQGSAILCLCRSLRRFRSGSCLILLLNSQAL